MHNNQVLPPLVGTRIFIMTSENALDSAAESRQAVARSMSTSPARIVSSNSARPLRLMPPTCSKCLSDPSLVRRRLVLLLPDIGAELACSITQRMAAGTPQWLPTAAGSAEFAPIVNRGWATGGAKRYLHSSRQQVHPLRTEVHYKLRPTQRLSHSQYYKRHRTTRPMQRLSHSRLESRTASVINTAAKPLAISRCIASYDQYSG